MVKSDLHDYVRESIKVSSQLFDECGSEIARAIDKIILVFESGGRMYLCGNGGSAADSQHIAAEFINGMSKQWRHPLPAMALTTDTSVLTSVGNDYSFDTVFKRQLEAYARPGDILFGISTSGASVNVGIAIEYAKNYGLTTVMLSGATKNLRLKNYADYNIRIPSSETQHIQEAMLIVEHFICLQVIKHFVTREKGI